MASGDNRHQKTVTAYHYTDQEGMRGIQQSGVIQPSNCAVFGRGTYFSAMDPSQGREAIAQNNWGRGGESNENRGRADYAIEVKLPAQQLRDVATDGRNVLKHDGPVHLDQYNWKSHAVGKGGNNY